MGLSVTETPRRGASSFLLASGGSPAGGRKEVTEAHKPTGRVCSSFPNVSDPETEVFPAAGETNF